MPSAPRAVLAVNKHDPSRICVREESGRVVVEVGDYELFDFVDDHLTENCDLEYEFKVSEVRAGREAVTMFFPSTTSTEAVEVAVATIPVAEVERIWSLNPPAGPGPAA